MAENLEKYRGLYEIVKTDINGELFGKEGLFGGAGSDHRGFKLFADWIDGENKNNENRAELAYYAIKKDKFINFLEREDKEGNKDLIAMVKGLPILQKETVQNNILLKLANEINKLDIIMDDEGLTVVNYDKAMLGALSLAPLQAATATVTTPTPTTATIATPTPTPAKSTPVNSTPAPTQKIEPKTDGETRETNSTEAKLASDATNLKIDSKSETETKKEISREATEKSAEKSVEIPAEEPKDKLPQSETQKLNSVIPEPAPAPITIPGKIQIPNISRIPDTSRIHASSHPASSTQSFTGDSEAEASLGETSGRISLPQTRLTSASTTAPRSAKRVQRRSGKNGEILRQPTSKNSTIQRINDPKQSTRNRQATPTQTAQPDQPAQGNNQSSRSEQSSRQRRGSQDKGSLAGKLAKLAGVGVGGGTFLALFSASGDSAEAATFAIYHASTIIQLFLK